MKAKEKEIISSCCVFASDGSEEVHVKESDCPIRREIGKIDGECTCIYKRGLGSFGILPCKYYEGTKRVTRNKRKVYKVLCGALTDTK